MNSCYNDYGTVVIVGLIFASIAFCMHELKLGTIGLPDLCILRPWAVLLVF